MTKEYVKFKGIKIIDRAKRKRRELFIKECLLMATKFMFLAGIMLIVEAVERANPTVFNNTVSLYLGVAGLCCVILSTIVINTFGNR